MKMIMTTVTACALALAVGGAVLAQGPMGGCDKCNQAQVQESQSIVQADPLRKFQMDTLDLRQDMMNKRFELQRENLKGTPDELKIAGLKADVSALQSRINNIRVLSGLPDDGKRDGECFKMDGGCDKNGGCNKNGGQMGGCNGQPCGQK